MRDLRLASPFFSTHPTSSTGSTNFFDKALRSSGSATSLEGWVTISSSRPLSPVPSPLHVGTRRPLHTPSPPLASLLSHPCSSLSSFEGAIHNQPNSHMVFLCSPGTRTRFANAPSRLSFFLPSLPPSDLLALADPSLPASDATMGEVPRSPACSTREASRDALF